MRLAKPIRDHLWVSEAKEDQEGPRALAEVELRWCLEKRCWWPKSNGCESFVDESAISLVA
jgi:hypothetical protein